MTDHTDIPPPRPARPEARIRTVLVRPPFYSILGMKLSYPLSLGYLQAALKASGGEAQAVDCDLLCRDYLKQHGLYSSWDKGVSEKLDSFYSDSSPIWDFLCEKILESNPHLVGFSSFTSVLTAVKLISERIKRARPEVLTVIGGVHATAAPEETLHGLGAIDCVARGEGETTLIELVQALEQGGDGRKIPGTVWRGPKGEPVPAEPRPRITDLDILPFPDRSLDRAETNGGRAYDVHHVLSSRGCPFNCNFCSSKAIWGRKVRFRSVDNLISEITQLRDSLNPRYLRIADDTFVLNRDNVFEFCRRAEAEGLSHIEFDVGSRIDTMRPEYVPALKRAGVRRISFGVETGSQRMQYVIQKKLKLPEVEEKLSLVTGHGIEALVFFMIGHPGETEDDARDTIRLMRKLNKNPLIYTDINILTPYPGTVLWEMAKQSGFSFDYGRSHHHFHQNRPVINLSAMSDERYLHHYQRILKMEKRTLRLRFFQRNLRLLSTDPRALARKVLRKLRPNR